MGADGFWYVVWLFECDVVWLKCVCGRAVLACEEVSGRAFPFSPVLRSDVTAPRIRTRPWYQTTRALGDRCAPFELRIPSGKERIGCTRMCRIREHVECCSGECTWYVRVEVP